MPTCDNNAHSKEYLWFAVLVRTKQLFGAQGCFSPVQRRVRPASAVQRFEERDMQSRSSGMAAPSPLSRGSTYAIFQIRQKPGCAVCCMFQIGSCLSLRVWFCMYNDSHQCPGIRWARFMNFPSQITPKLQSNGKYRERGGSESHHGVHGGREENNLGHDYTCKWCQSINQNINFLESERGQAMSLKKKNEAKERPSNRVCEKGNRVFLSNHNGDLVKC